MGKKNKQDRARVLPGGSFDDMARAAEAWVHYVRLHPEQESTPLCVNENSLADDVELYIDRERHLVSRGLAAFIKSVATKSAAGKDSETETVVH